MSSDTTDLADQTLAHIQQMEKARLLKEVQQKEDQQIACSSTSTPAPEPTVFSPTLFALLLGQHDICKNIFFYLRLRDIAALALSCQAAKYSVRRYLSGLPKLLRENPSLECISWYARGTWSLGVVKDNVILIDITSFAFHAIPEYVKQTGLCYISNNIVAISARKFNDIFKISCIYSAHVLRGTVSDPTFLNLIQQTMNVRNAISLGHYHPSLSTFINHDVCKSYIFKEIDLPTNNTVKFLHARQDGKTFNIIINKTMHSTWTNGYSSQYFIEIYSNAVNTIFGMNAVTTIETHNLEGWCANHYDKWQFRTDTCDTYEAYLPEEEGEEEETAQPDGCLLQ